MQSNGTLATSLNKIERPCASMRVDRPLDHWPSNHYFWARQDDVENFERWTNKNFNQIEINDGKRVRTVMGPKTFLNHALSLSLSLSEIPMYVGSIDSNIPASQILFTFRQLRCQDSILSDMCYQLNRGSKLYVLTITIGDIPVWFFFQFFSSSAPFFAIQFDSVNHFQFPRVR